MNPRARRIENEWKAFDALAAANNGRLARVDAHTVALDEWRVRFDFPEYYPAVPLEAYVTPPVEHPNVHPETGFICLWDTHQAGTAVVEALQQTLRIVHWHLQNRRPEHVMQDLPDRPPRDYPALAVPADYYLNRSAGELPGPRRTRLSEHE